MVERLAPILLGFLVMLSTAAEADTAREKAERLAAIGIATEWVVANCGPAEFDGMLLLTMRSVVRTLEPDDLTRLRANFSRRVAREFPTKAQACDVWRGRLVAIQ